MTDKQKVHFWKATYFSSPTWCDLCGAFVWGTDQIHQNGWQCDSCHTCAHFKCVQNNSDICTTVHRSGPKDRGIGAQDVLIVFLHSLEAFRFVDAVQILSSLLYDPSVEAIQAILPPLLVFTSCESAYYSLFFFDKLERSPRIISLYSKVQEACHVICSNIKSINIDQYEITNGDSFQIIDGVKQKDDMERDSTSQTFSQLKFIEALLYQIGQMFINFRKRLFSVYLTLKTSNHPPPDYLNLAQSLKSLQNQIEESLDNPYLSQLKQNILSETKLLYHLLMAQYLISNLELRDAVFVLYQCKVQLDAWTYKFKDDLTIQEEKKSNSSTNRFSGVFFLINWMKQFLSFLAAKLKFYFHDTFLGEPPKKLDNIESFDFLTEVYEFQLKTSCTNISIIASQVHQLEGGSVDDTMLVQFDTVLSYPKRVYMAKHFIVLRNLIQQNIRYFQHGDILPVRLRDKNKPETYFASKIEGNLYLAIVFENEIEDETVALDFMQNLVCKLRGKTLFDFESSNEIQK